MSKWFRIWLSFIKNDSKVWFRYRWAQATKTAAGSQQHQLAFFFPYCILFQPEPGLKVHVERQTNCEPDADISAQGAARTKIAHSHLPACHWPFICINSCDLWAAQISASCSPRPASWPHRAQAFHYFDSVAFAWWANRQGHWAGGLCRLQTLTEAFIHHWRSQKPREGSCHPRLCCHFS